MPWSSGLLLENSKYAEDSIVEDYKLGNMPLHNFVQTQEAIPDSPNISLNTSTWKFSNWARQTVNPTLFDYHMWAISDSEKNKIYFNTKHEIKAMITVTFSNIIMVSIIQAES